MSCIHTQCRLSIQSSRSDSDQTDQNNKVKTVPINPSVWIWDHRMLLYASAFIPANISSEISKCQFCWQSSCLSHYRTSTMFDRWGCGFGSWAVPFSPHFPLFIILIELSFVSSVHRTLFHTSAVFFLCDITGLYFGGESSRTTSCRVFLTYYAVLKAFSSRG